MKTFGEHPLDATSRCLKLRMIDLRLATDALYKLSEIDALIILSARIFLSGAPTTIYYHRERYLPTNSYSR